MSEVMNVGLTVSKCTRVGGFSIELGWSARRPFQGLVTVAAGQDIPRLSWLGLGGRARITRPLKGRPRKISTGRKQGQSACFTEVADVCLCGTGKGPKDLVNRHCHIL